MANIKEIISKLELAQIGWVVPNIQTASQFLSNSLGVPSFPQSVQVSAQDLHMTYYGKIVEAEWLTTQTYNGNIFIELIQPIAGKSMFHDYLHSYPNGGVQHFAFRLPINDANAVISELNKQQIEVISEVNHPIAQMTFFDTYQALGVATEIMGVTQTGWEAIKQMQKTE